MTSRRFINAREITNQARGRWIGILQHVCPGMFEAAIENIGHHVRCPIHGGDADFRFYPPNSPFATEQSGSAICSCGHFSGGFDLIQAASGLSFREALELVDEYLNGSSPAVVSARNSAPKAAPYIPKEVVRDEKVLNRIRSLWNPAKNVTSTERNAYLMARGIHPSTLEGVRNLRWLKQLGYYEGLPGGRFQKVGAFPAMLGLLRDENNEATAIHRTWLERDQSDKAPVRCPRKLTKTVAPVSGSAIRLFSVDEGTEILGLAEGIETALAARELSTLGHWDDISTIPVWACFSAGNISGFKLPKGLKNLKKIIVFADNDERETGQEAGEKLKERFANDHPHIEVEIRAPNAMGWDWLDHLVNSKS